MGNRSFGRHSGVAPPGGSIPSAGTVRSAMEAPLHVGSSISFPTGGMECPKWLGRPAMAGAYWNPGLAGYSPSTLDLSDAHGLAHSRACATTAVWASTGDTSTTVAAS